VENLFSYGTLRDEKVQHALFGRSLEGAADTLLGYRLGPITLVDRSSGESGEYRIIDPTGREGDRVEGTVLRVTASELQRADAYEDVAYKRIRVRLQSGVDAWVYVRA